MNKRIFRIETPYETREVFPINGGELIYNWKRPDGAVYFIRELKTRLVFNNNSKTGVTDFNYFYALESDISTRCLDIVCNIYEVCNNVEKLEYTGQMPLIKGEWDVDKCTVSMELEQQKNAYDGIKDFKRKTDIPVASYCPFAFGTPDIDTSNAFYLYDVDGGVNAFLNITQFDIGGNVYGYHDDTIGSGIRYSYGLFASLCYAIVLELLVKTGRNGFLEALRSDFFDWNAKGDTPGYVASSIPKLDNSLPSINFPTGTYGDRFIYLPRTPGINYYTGQPNLLTHLLFLPKSNANRTQAGTSEWEEPLTPSLEINSNKLTFAEIEKIWAIMFQAYWFIDTDGCMRVEHISYFNNNSTTFNSLIEPHAKYNKANNKFKRKDDLLPKLEKFLFSANLDKLNGSVETNANQNNEILYESVCVNRDKDNDEMEYPLPLVVTDFKCLGSAEGGSYTQYYNNTGITLWTAEFGAIYNVNTVFGYPYKIAQTDAANLSEPLLNVIDPTTYQNGHVQWANLIRRYLKDKRVLTIGKNGNEYITFTNRTIKSKEQKNIFLKYCCDDESFNPDQSQIITGLGTGEVTEAEFNTLTGLINITAFHD